ncbi:hypothetical protein [Streptococcus pyogenes]|uniref:hypothetical protein n=1 Tax=Streptococcus pyogenes TaxID=1314 RepID=UPI0010EC2D3D|nr:hypothetical protein [Streptococcus pyogenes]VHM51641.1 Uncharacterised protein [Streptococcus pyogenes]
MHIITQLNLFEDQELGDLEKILMVLDGLPETDLFQRLEAKRKHGRRDYSVQSSLSPVSLNAFFSLKPTSSCSDSYG